MTASFRNGASSPGAGTRRGPALRHQQPAGAKSRRALCADAGDHARKSTAAWVDGLAALGVPCGAVNTLEQVFADPQVQARGMRLDMPHASAAAAPCPLIANPLKMSATPPSYGTARLLSASTPTRSCRSCSASVKPSAPGCARPGRSPEASVARGRRRAAARSSGRPRSRHRPPADDGRNCWHRSSGRDRCRRLSGRRRRNRSDAGVPGSPPSRTSGRARGSRRDRTRPAAGCRAAAAAARITRISAWAVGSATLLDPVVVPRQHRAVARDDDGTDRHLAQRRRGLGLHQRMGHRRGRQRPGNS